MAKQKKKTMPVRGFQIGVRLSPEEFATVEQAADLDKLSVATWLRRVALLEAERIIAESKKPKK